MAITQNLGGIKVGENKILTSMPVHMLMDLGISGMAFEPKEHAGLTYDHLDERVAQLAPARGTMQRSFFAPAMRDHVVVDPETGQKRKERRPDGWSPTAKYKNATGSLTKYIGGPFLEEPINAILPAFVLYRPEPLAGDQRDEFNAYMGGEFFLYEIDPALRFMIADGESRYLALERCLDPKGGLSGSLREKLRHSLVDVIILHGVGTVVMAQMYSDLNGQGVVMAKAEINAVDTRSPWAKATREIFDKLNVPLATTGRQVTAAHEAQHKHLMVNQAITMVRALGTGSVSKALSSSDLTDDIAGVKYDKIVRAGIDWFGTLLDHFEAGTVDGVRDAAFLSDPELVVRTMPVKVALAALGHAWVVTNLPAQIEARSYLTEVNWRVSMGWNNLAGKVAPKKIVKGRGKQRTVEVIDGEFTVAAASGKQIGSAALRAIKSGDTKAGRAVRGLNTEGAIDDEGGEAA